MSSDTQFFNVYNLSDSDLLDHYWNIQGDGEICEHNRKEVLKWLQYETCDDDNDGTSWSDQGLLYIFRNPDQNENFLFNSWVVHRYHQTKTWNNAVETYRHNLFWDTWDLEAQPLDTDPPR